MTENSDLSDQTMLSDSAEASEPDAAMVAPSWFSKAFTALGFLVAITALAWCAAQAIVFFAGWPEYTLSIFGMAWGLLARWFQWTVARGIKVGSAAGQAAARARIRGEQLWAAGLFRALITVELMASLTLLVAQLLS